MAAYDVASLALHVYDVGLGFFTSEKAVHSIGISLLQSWCLGFKPQQGKNMFNLYYSPCIIFSFMLMSVFSVFLAGNTVSSSSRLVYMLITAGTAVCALVVIRGSDPSDAGKLLPGLDIVSISCLRS